LHRFRRLCLLMIYSYELDIEINNKLIKRTASSSDSLLADNVSRQIVSNTINPTSSIHQCSAPRAGGEAALGITACGASLRWIQSLLPPAHSLWEMREKSIFVTGQAHHPHPHPSRSAWSGRWRGGDAGEWERAERADGARRAGCRY
jgi:hypothetical protein